MRLTSIVTLSSLLVLALAAGCGGTVVVGDEQDGGAGSGGTGATGGTGGTAGIGGSGGLGGGGSGGMGGSPSGGMGGGGMGGSPSGGMGGTAAGGMGGSAGGACWNYLPAYTPCRTCLDQNCCGEVIACFEDPQGFCSSGFFCYESCTSPDPLECVTQCGKGMNNPAYNNLMNCGAGTCMEACTAPPPPYDCPLESGIPECDECIDVNCGFECNACLSNEQCLSLLDCIQYCSDDPCINECVNQYPGGIDDLMTLLGSDGCIAANCGEPCYF